MPLASASFPGAIEELINPIQMARLLIDPDGYEVQVLRTCTS
jgi:hypothetical protein